VTADGDAAAVEFISLRQEVYHAGGNRQWLRRAAGYTNAATETPAYEPGGEN